MKRFLFFLFLSSLVSFSFGFIFRDKLSFIEEQFPHPTSTPIPRPLDKYSIDTLSKTVVQPGTLALGKELSSTDLYTSYEFTHQFDPTFTGTSLSTVSGMAIVPKGEGPFPLVFMVRGYVDPTIYSTGVGTHRAAEFFASHGFLTIAPDFLGYADSTTEAGNVFESRFQTYTTALSVLQSVSSLSQWDHKHIFLWAHSNGGQIALTLLEVTGKDYPTVLWAPVTKPFPYSVLYYTDESADQGKFLRQETAKFESVYDASFYSLTTYMDRIVAPIQLHQGTADDAVPYDWSQSFVSRLKSLKKDVTFFTYPGADHNLQPDWSTVVQRDLDFYQKYLSI